MTWAKSKQKQTKHLTAEKLCVVDNLTLIVITQEGWKSMTLNVTRPLYKDLIGHTSAVITVFVSGYYHLEKGSNFNICLSSLYFLFAAFDIVKLLVIFRSHSYFSCYFRYIAATCPCSLSLATFHWNSSIKKVRVL